MLPQPALNGFAADKGGVGEDFIERRMKGARMLQVAGGEIGEGNAHGISLLFTAAFCQSPELFSRAECPHGLRY